MQVFALIEMLARLALIAQIEMLARLRQVKS
jgi:hypothetical protein